MTAYTCGGGAMNQGTDHSYALTQNAGDPYSIPIVMAIYWTY